LRRPIATKEAATSVFETSRLLMRQPTLADFPDSFAMWQDPKVARFTVGRPSIEEEAWTRLLRYVGHWSLLGFGYWTVREKGTGRFVGEVGFANYHRELTPAFGDRPELGWVLASWSHGQGYATEAASAALAWGWETWGERETVCMIAPANAPSLNVAGKLGFKEMTRTRYKGAPTILFTRSGPPP
jgi:RimJ/RimL family protein N-acetyltransferase